MVLQWYTRKVKKINKKLLTIAIALVIFVIVASPVSALPTKSPLPTANPWNQVWGLFQNLQTQIDGLTARMTAVEAKDTNLQTQITGLDTRMDAVETKGTFIMKQASALDSTSPKTQGVSCGSGHKVLGGGGAIGLDQAGDKIFIRVSTPSQEDGWVVVAEEATDTNHDWLLETFAICT